MSRLLIKMDEIEKQVELEQIKQGEYDNYAASILAMALIIRLELSTPILSRRDLESRLTSISNQLRQVQSKYDSEFKKGVADLASNEAKNNLFKAYNELKAINAIETTPIFGLTFSDFIRQWHDNEIKLITSAIRQSYFEGMPNTQIIDTVLGTKARQFKDGTFYSINNISQAEIGSAIQFVAMVAALEAIDDGDKYQWVSVLDGRTSAICRARSGMVFRKGSGPIPPAHRKCRSSIRPYSNDGMPTYYEWLKGKPLAFQEKVIGKKMAKLLNEGGMTAKQFSQFQLDKKFMPIKGGLSALRERNPEAFANAGL